MLLQPGVTAIDSWWNAPDRFAVEIIVPKNVPDPLPGILSEMMSPHLKPQLHLVHQGGGHHYLAVEGSTAELDLRLLRVATE